MASNLLPLFYAWLEQFCSGPNRCSHLSSNSLAYFCSSLSHSLRPWRSRASKTHPFGGLSLASSEVLVRRTTSGTWLAGVTCPTMVLVGISMEQVLKLCRQIGTLEDPGCSSPWVTVGTTAVGNWGPGVSSVSTWTHIQCPLTLELVCTLTVLNGGMVTFCVVWTGPLMSSRQNSLTSTGSPLGEEWITSFSTPVSFELGWGSCSDPDSSKWACLHIMVAFTSSLLVIKLMALSMILDPTITGTISE